MSEAVGFKLNRLEGKVALITGAARGQGRAHAVRLAEEGADIIALDICEQIDTVHIPMATPEDLEETVRLVEKTGKRIVARQADVRSTQQLKDVVDAGLAEFGHIDVVCANAAITNHAPIQEMNDVMWDDIVAVNLTGVFKTARAALPSMIQAGNGGSIIFTGSTASLKGFGIHTSYTAAKHGIIGLMRSLVNEVSPHNIRVNCVHPSSVNTPMIMNEYTWSMFDAENPNPEAMGEVFLKENIMPIKWMEPEDISNAVVWLASDDARYVTGINLPIDAGKNSRSR